MQESADLFNLLHYVSVRWKYMSRSDTAVISRTVFRHFCNAGDDIHFADDEIDTHGQTEVD